MTHRNIDLQDSLEFIELLEELETKIELTMASLNTAEREVTKTLKYFAARRREQQAQRTLEQPNSAKILK